MKTTDELFTEMNRVTAQYIREHPLDPDAHIRYVASDQWELRTPFIYADWSQL